MLNKKGKIIIVLAVLIWFAAIGIRGVLFLQGEISWNVPSKTKYPVRGVDVSAYQGDIDWQTLSKQGISFAFIKATEGSGHVDLRFVENYTNAQDTDLRIGAYHFFSFDSGGDTQAENFINTVPEIEGMLPPVIDVEFYGDKASNLPDVGETQRELQILLDALEAQYGRKPIIYATNKSYHLYIADAFQEYDIWIRNIVSAPRLKDSRSWTFWQYSDRERLEGYSGEEECIDVNVFYGTEAEFKDYGQRMTEVTEKFS